MKQHKKRTVQGTLTCLGTAGALLLTPAAASAVDLPVANCTTAPGGNCLRINDFNVFSLSLLDQVYPGGTYIVPASPGQIKDYTIIGQNNGQSGAGNTVGVDGAYTTPSNNTAETFSTVSANPGGIADPNGASEFTGDSENSWDIRISALNQISGTPIVFFFSFNETGKDNGLMSTDLLIWGKATLTQDDGGPSKTFYLGGQPALGTNSPLESALPPPTGPDTDFTNQATYDYGPWLYVHAGLCVVGSQFVGFPDSNGQCTIGNSEYKSANVGNNNAAFMMNSPELDAAVKSGEYDTLQVTWEMAYMNGGGESAWIQTVSNRTQIPEPAPVALLTLGLGALAWNSRRTCKHRERQDRH